MFAPFALTSSWAKAVTWGFAAGEVATRKGRKTGMRANIAVERDKDDILDRHGKDWCGLKDEEEK